LDVFGSTRVVTKRVAARSDGRRRESPWGVGGGAGEVRSTVDAVGGQAVDVDEPLRR
jgi:hypothetical protein